MESDEESEYAMGMAKSQKGATSVKGSIYHRSSKKLRPAESENGYNITIKGTPLESENRNMGTLPNISETINRKGNKIKNQKTKGKGKF